MVKISNHLFGLFWLVASLDSAFGVLDRRNFGRNEWDNLHITARAQKRDDSGCPAAYILCPASMNGGCCPSDRSCGTDSCYPTTAGPQTACGMSGYFACDIAHGGGCCPQGSVCDGNGCSPLPGSSFTMDCGTASYLCPASLGQGCCKNGMACGISVCYATSYQTGHIQVTFTTTDSNAQPTTVVSDSATVFRQTLIQPSPTSSAAIAKITASASAVPKVAQTSAPSSGLSTGSLAGIIAAAVIVLIAIIIATWLIIRRLNAVAREAQRAAAAKTASASKTRSSSRPHPRVRNGGSSTAAIDFDNMSIDPLMMTSESVASPTLPRPSAVYSDYDRTGGLPIPAPYGSPTAFSGGYQQVPTAEYYSDSGSGHLRNLSQESTPGSYGQTPQSGGMQQTGYFDPLDPALRDQNLRFGHPPIRPSLSLHGRNFSDASEVSQQSDSSGGFAELDAGADGDRRSSLQRAMQGMGLGRTASRRGSQGYTPSLGHRRRSSSGATARQEMDSNHRAGNRLEDVAETELDRTLTAERNISEQIAPLSQQQLLQHNQQQQQHDEQQQQDEQNIGMQVPVDPGLEIELERRERQKIMGLGKDLRRGPDRN